MLKWFFICWTVLVSHTAFATGLSEQIDELMLAHVGVTFPSGAVLVIENGAILHQRGYGIADLENNIPATASTNYRIGSVSKAFTALAIVILAERGLVDYEAAITDYLEEFPDYGKQIKILHLLHHTSGIPDYRSLISCTQTEQIKDQDVVEMLREQTSTDFVPGSQFRYCNAGYAVLAMIVERVSGMSFSQFLLQEIFTPLGMCNSAAYENSLLPLPNRAYGYTQKSKGQFVLTDQDQASTVLGDGGIYSSLTDMFYWDQALYHPLLVSEVSMDKIFTPARLNDGTQSGYGFGWKIGVVNGNRCISHIGSTIGFRSAFLRFPDHKFSVFVVVNETNTLANEISNQIVEMYFKN